MRISSPPPPPPRPIPLASGASFRPAERGGEKERETLPDSRKVFEVTAARSRTSGLVNIVLSRQTIVKLFFIFQVQASVY